MEPIRILHVVGGMGTGGIETLIMNWFRIIDRSVVQFDFLVHSQKRGFYEDEIEVLGGKVYHCSILDDHNFIKYLNFLKKFFSEHIEYKIIHGHHSAFGPFYLWAAKKAGIPCRISHSHIASFSKTLRGYIKFIITRFFGKFANHHFACSYAAGNYMYGKKSTYTIINNGIDTVKFTFSQEKRQLLRGEFGLIDKLVIVHVGRFFDQKNHTFLIDVFHSLKKINYNAVMLLIGVGPLQDNIKRRVNELGLDESVLFLNNRSDVQDILSASDVFLFPSLYEGLPLTLVEAQASGLPVVCSDMITNETKLADNYHTLSLNDSIDKWAKEVVYAYEVKMDRIRAAYDVKEKGYDSCVVIERLIEFYKMQLE